MSKIPIKPIITRYRHVTAVGIRAVNADRLFPVSRQENGFSFKPEYMKLEIGDKILEVDIINAPRGSFSYDFNIGDVFFDALYALHREDGGTIKVYPVWFDEFGNCFIDENLRISYEIDDFTLQGLVKPHALEMDIPLSESAEEMVFDFLQHDTPFTLKAAKYAMKVLPEDSPVRNAIALKTGLDGIR